MTKHLETKLVDGAPTIRGGGLSRLALLGLFAALSGCGARQVERVEGETHWLSSCLEETCGGGLSCICGVCTEVCSGANDCAALGSAAVCAAGDTTVYSDDCSVGAQQLCVRDLDVEVASEPPTPSDDASTDEQLDSTSAPDDDVPDVCANPRVTPSESAATPRANTIAEAFALLVGGGIVASDADYERAALDFPAMVALDERLADAVVQGPFFADVGFWLGGRVEGSVPSPLGAEWQCLNEVYGAEIVEQELDENGERSFSIELGGVFNLALAAEDYGKLPGVISVGYGGGLPPPSGTDDLAYIRGATRDGDVWTYRFGIMKVTCGIEVSITSTVAGSAEISEWVVGTNGNGDGEPCQRE